MHIFWKCRKCKHFWKEVNDLKIKGLETPLDITPMQHLFGTEMDRTLHPISVKRIGIISYKATFDLFKQLLMHFDTSRMKQRTYYLYGRLMSSREYGCFS